MFLNFKTRDFKVFYFYFIEFNYTTVRGYILYNFSFINYDLVYSLRYVSSYKHHAFVSLQILYPMVTGCGVVYVFIG